MMQIKFYFNNFARVCHSLAACQRHTPSSLAAVNGLSNNYVISLRSFNSLRCVRQFVACTGSAGGGEAPWSWNTFSFWTFNGNGKFAHFYKIWKRRKPHISVVSTQVAMPMYSESLQLWPNSHQGYLLWLPQRTFFDLISVHAIAAVSLWQCAICYLLCIAIT